MSVDNKHDLEIGDECPGIYVKDGVLDARYLGQILMTLQKDGRCLVTGVKTINLPKSFLRDCARFLEDE
jgi:hypothetical protein